jgi:hypothetical protein
MSEIDDIYLNTILNNKKLFEERDQSKDCDFQYCVKINEIFKFCLIQTSIKIILLLKKKRKKSIEIG